MQTQKRVKLEIKKEMSRDSNTVLTNADASGVVQNGIEITVTTVGSD